MGGGRRSGRISIFAAIAVLGVVFSNGGALAQPVDPPATTGAPTTNSAAPTDQPPATNAPAPPTTTSPSARAPANAPAQAATAGGNAAAAPLQLADLSVTKTGPGTATPGTDFSYAITVTNNGPDAAQTVSLTDAVLGSTTFVSFTQNSGPAFGCALPAVGGSGTVTCTIASLPNGSSAGFTLTVHLDPDVTGGQIVSNFANVNATTADTNTGNNRARADTTALVSSDLSVTTTGPATASPNTNISYLVTVTNNGPSSASVVLDDSTPFSAGFVSFTQNSGPAFTCTFPPVGTQQGNVNCNSVGLMPPGTSSVFTLTVLVHPATPNGTVITNTAGVQAVGGSFDPNNSNDSSSASTTVSISADIAVTKTVNNPSPNVGSNVTFTVTAHNNGPTNATGVVVTDPLPAGMAFVSASASQGGYTSGSGVWAVGSIASGGNATLQIVATVSQAGPHTNTATKTAEDQQDTNAANDSASAVVNGQQSDLAVTKTDAPDPVASGADLTYTMTVTNNGPSSAQNVTLSDTLPAGTTFVSANPSQGSCAGTTTVSCPLGSIANGASVTITLVVHVGLSVADGAVISNTASVSTTTPDPVAGNNSATSTTTVAASADLAVTKTDAPDPVTAGSNLTYTITVTNNGPSNASSVSVADALPAGTTFVGIAAPPAWSSTVPPVGGTGTVTETNPLLAPGAPATFTLVVHVNAGTPDGTTITNTATASSTTSDPTPSDNSATETTTVAAAADLAVTKSDSPDPVTAGTDLTYTIQVTNSGPSNALDATVSDALPAGTTYVSAMPSLGSCAGTTSVTCSLGSMAAGASATITLVVHVDPSVASGSVISNTASATTSTPDPAAGNNSATSTTTVETSADLAVTKSDAPDPVNPGAALTYTITVSNGGPSAASNVTLTDNVPGGTTFASLSSPAGWNCSTPGVGATGTVTCTAPVLAPGSPATFTLVVNVDPQMTGNVINGASVSSATADPAAGNNSAIATTAVNPAADLAVTKTDSPDPVTAGTDLTYTIVAANNGPANAQTVTLTDALPVGTTFVSLTPATGWNCVTPAVGSSGTVTCTAPALVTFDSAGFTLVVHVDPSVTDGTVIGNTASLSSATTDPVPGNDSATATTTVNTSANLTVTKSGPPTPVAAGSDLTYTITVANSGPSDAQNVAVSDPLPAGTTFVSAMPSTGSCSGTATVTCSLGSMAASGSATITLVVHVGSGVAAGTVITNTASVTSTTPDPNPGGESGSTSTEVLASADVALTKSDGPDPVTAGTDLTYTINAANTGPSDAQNVSMTDALPGGSTFVSLASPAGWACTLPAVGAAGNVTCNIPSLTAGAADVFTLVVHVDPALPDGFVLTNTAFAVTTTFESNLDNDTATATTTVATQAPSADLAVTKTDAPDPVVAGNNITYTIGVANNGPSAAQNTSVSDTLPAGTTFVSATTSMGSCAGATTVTCTLGSLAVGASATITLVVHVAPSVAAGTVIGNSATASSSTTDPTAANNSAAANTTVAAAADLAVTKTDTPDPATAGTDLTYTIGVTNAGPSDAASVTLTDPLPAGTSFVSATPSQGSCAGTGTVSCNLGSLASGASASVTLTVHVGSGVGDGTVLSNTATASSGANDPDPSNNSATATTTVVTSGDLLITKTDSPDPVAPGGDLTYAITVTNNGPSDASNITVTDALPAGTTFVSATPSTGSCTGTTTVTCTIPSIPNGASATITLVVHVDPATPAGTVISNTASVNSPAEVTATTADPNPGNNSATATTTVAAASEVPGEVPGSPGTPRSPATPGSPAEPAPAGVGAGAAAAAVPVVANPTFTG